MDDFVREFTNMPLTLIAALRVASEDAAVNGVAIAKDKLGTYQKAYGPFPAWPKLAESTLEDKAAMGYPSPSPLLRTGAMAETITAEVSKLSPAVFKVKLESNSPYAEYHEYGTINMPARPFLGPAGLEAANATSKVLGLSLAIALENKDPQAVRISNRRVVSTLRNRLTRRSKGR